MVLYLSGYSVVKGCFPLYLCCPTHGGSSPSSFWNQRPSFSTQGPSYSLWRKALAPNEGSLEGWIHVDSFLFCSSSVWKSYDIRQKHVFSDMMTFITCLMCGFVKASDWWGVGGRAPGWVVESRASSLSRCLEFPGRVVGGAPRISLPVFGKGIKWCSCDQHVSCCRRQRLWIMLQPLLGMHPWHLDAQLMQISPFKVALDLHFNSCLS